MQAEKELIKQSKRLSKNKQRLIGFVISGLQIFVSVVSGLLFTPFLISSLGPVEYGLYQLLYSAIGYVAVLDLGLGGTITRYLIKYDSNETREKQKSVVTMCLYLYIGLSAIAFIAIIGVSFGLKGIFTSTITNENIIKAKSLFLIMGISSCLSLFDHAFTGILTAYEQYTVTKGFRIVRDVVRMLLLVILFRMGFDSFAIVIVDLLLMTIITISDAIIGRRMLGNNYFSGKIDKLLFKSILFFSFYTFLQVVVTQINVGLDRVLLGRFSTLFLVGMYGVAMQIYNMYNSFGSLFGGLTLPLITRVVCEGNNDEVITNHCIKYSRVQCLIMFPLLSGFLLYGQQFITLWMKDKYNSLHLWLVIVIIIVPNILEWIETPIFNVMKAKNMQKTRSLLLISVTIGNLFLTVILVKINQVFGAAIGTAISFFIGNNILSNVYYHKRVGINMKSYFKGILTGLFPAWLLSIILGFLIRLLPGIGLINFIFKCLTYVVVYVSLMYFIGINAEEKEILINVKSKLFKKR